MDLIQTITIFISSKSAQRHTQNFIGG